MSVVESTSGSKQEKKTGIRWKRVVLGALLADVIVIMVLLAITTTYTFVIAPGRTEAEYSEWAQLAGYYVAPTTGAISTFVVVFWLARGLKSSFIANGLLTGVVGALLTVGFLATAQPEHRAMYMISFGLKIVGGYAGGLAARQMLYRRTQGVVS